MAATLFAKPNNLTPDETYRLGKYIELRLPYYKENAVSQSEIAHEATRELDFVVTLTNVGTLMRGMNWTTRPEPKPKPANLEQDNAARIDGLLKRVEWGEKFQASVHAILARFDTRIIELEKQLKEKEVGK